jgi:hypothetical protein
VAGELLCAVVVEEEDEASFLPQRSGMVAWIVSMLDWAGFGLRRGLLLGLLHGLLRSTR